MRRSICFAGGCFWGMEALYRRLPGVLDVTAGYANGDTADHANYDDVCTGRTGFREAVQVAYEDGTVSLPHLLFVFFAAIDPETPNRQGPDVGSQYQTGVYWMDPADEGIIRSIAALEAAAVPFFAVELKALACFYPAEEFISGIWKSTHGATATWPPGNWPPCRTSPFPQRPIPVPQKSCCRPGKKPEKCLSDGRGKLCFPQADHICVNKSAAGGCLRRSL